MTPLRFVTVRGAAPLRSHRVEAASLPTEITPVDLTLANDRSAVVTLASQCQSGDPPESGRFAPAGLLTELDSRPGRAVHAWLAWPMGKAAPASDGGCAERGPLGLVALVAAGPRPRFSIAWLLVHPEGRRRGIATALVAHAVAHAWSLGAMQVHAETLPSWPSAVGFWQSVGFRQES